MLALSSTAARGVAAACAIMQRPKVQRIPGFPAPASSRGCGRVCTAPQRSVSGARTTGAAATNSSGLSSEAASQQDSAATKPAPWFASLAPGRPAAEQLLLAAPCLPLAACKRAGSLALLAAAGLVMWRVWASMEIANSEFAEREAWDRCRKKPPAAVVAELHCKVRRLNHRLSTTGILASVAGVVCAALALAARVTMTSTGWQPEPSLISAAKWIGLGLLLWFVVLLFKDVEEVRDAHRVFNAVAAMRRQANVALRSTARGGGQQGSMP